MSALLCWNTNDFYILEVRMNQIDETQEQHMKFDLIDSTHATKPHHCQLCNGQQWPS